MMVETAFMEALQILSGGAAVIAEGEVMQLPTAEEPGDRLKAYLEIIAGQTAELFGAACEVGAGDRWARTAERAAARLRMALGLRSS